MEDFKKENREKIVERILKQSPTIPIMVAELDNKRLELHRLQDQRSKEADDIEKQIKDLQNKKNKVIADYNEKISSDFSSFTNLREKLILSEIEGVDDSALSYIDLNYRDYDYGEDLSTVSSTNDRIEAIDVLDSEYIEIELSEDYLNKEKETARIKQAVDEMKEALEEVMLFDESKLKPLFEEILNVKQKVKAKYNAVFLS